MKNGTGYLFLGLGTLGFLFFLIYGGAAIPEREMWFVLSIVMAGVGGYWVLRRKWEKARVDNAAQFSHSYDLRYNGEKIRVTLDNCEVKSRSYQQDITNYGLPSRIEMYNGNRNYKTKEVLQTYIVYYKIINGVEYTFVSDARSVSREVMRRFLEGQKGVDLYIDKNDATIYMFDLPNL